MNRIMKPAAVAVIGASSNEDGKIGNSVMKNLINGGYKGTDRTRSIRRPTTILGYQGLPVGQGLCRA